MNDPDTLLLAEALRERVADEYPDLDKFAQVAVRTGTGVRLRRYAALGLSSFALAAIAGTIFAMLPGESSNSSLIATAHSSRPASPSPAGSDPCEQASRRDAALAPTPDRSKSKPGYTRNNLRPLTLIDRGPWQCPQTPSAPTTEHAPVALKTDEFMCGDPMDGKFGCTSTDGKTIVSIVWRPAAEHETYLNPTKAGKATGTIRMLGGIGTVTDEMTVVGPVHGHWFVTVSIGSNATLQDLANVAQGLVWTD